MLVDLKVTDFLNKVAGSDPVPGGGSVAALNGYCICFGSYGSRLDYW